MTQLRIWTKKTINVDLYIPPTAAITSISASGQKFLVVEQDVKLKQNQLGSVSASSSGAVLVRACVDSIASLSASSSGNVQIEQAGCAAHPVKISSVSLSSSGKLFVNNPKSTITVASVSGSSSGAGSFKGKTGTVTSISVSSSGKVNFDGTWTFVSGSVSSSGVVRATGNSVKTLGTSSSGRVEGNPQSVNMNLHKVTSAGGTTTCDTSLNRFVCASATTRRTVDMLSMVAVAAAQMILWMTL